ncbi:MULTISPECIES: aldo/keto reductase [Paracoccus]|uniref:aldo/keto reductase n=1 Tax=Paracoccus TaxID=265 RepID=UPI00086EEF81|nr:MULTISPECIES: aldo/keto reductase [Paracoccus]ODT60870.1 MAG: aldo/keto reductase [Paracoccus sp. SCN 68-21]
MERRQLGQGGPMVGAVALGTMNFMGTYGAADPRDSLAVIDACIEMGIDHIDTSDVYGGGGAEEMLAPVLARHRGRVTIASKAGITRNPDHPFDNSPTYLRAALEGSLRRMGVERIDLYYLHRREAARPVEEAMEALLRLRDEGKIGAIGLSEVAPATLERACAVGPVAAVQSEYSLWSRQVELGMTDACARHGAALVAFSPLGRGVFRDAPPDPAGFAPGDLRTTMPRFQPDNWARNLPRLRAFGDWARDRGECPAAVAIAWVLSRAPHVIALPGSRSVDHWRQIARGAALRLDAEALDQIERLLPAGWAHGPRYEQAMALGPEGWS